MNMYIVYLNKDENVLRFAPRGELLERKRGYYGILWKKITNLTLHKKVTQKGDTKRWHKMWHKKVTQKVT